MDKILKKIKELLHDLQNGLDEDYASGEHFDTDSWETTSDVEIISFDAGYISACLYIRKLIEENADTLGTITVDMSDEDCQNILDGQTLGTWLFPIFDKNGKEVAGVNVDVVPENMNDEEE